MKKFYLLITIILITCTTNACDICGCGLGNYYIGMLPQFDRSFIGMRYHYMHYHTQLANDKTQFSNDYFQSTEIWGGMNIGKRLQVLAFIPYSFNKQISDDGLRKSNGLGDIALLVNFPLLEKSSLNKNNKLVFQELKIGGGIKLATGKSEIDPSASDIVALANSQLGSGSTDYMVNAAYTLRINKAGFTTNMNYKVNTENKENYQFGNRFSSNNFFFYSVKEGIATLTPNLGILYQYSAPNSLDKQKVEQTGGYLTSGAIGLEVSIKKISLGFNAQLPIVQNFSSGQTKSKFIGMAHVTVSL